MYVGTKIADCRYPLCFDLKKSYWIPPISSSTSDFQIVGITLTTGSVFPVPVCDLPVVYIFYFNGRLKICQVPEICQKRAIVCLSVSSVVFSSIQSTALRIIRQQSHPFLWESRSQQKMFDTLSNRFTTLSRLDGFVFNYSGTAGRLSSGRLP
ncbi:uncharacterized protein LOC124315651 [Daphnia pulicaria]|uniref:uncharacterized protein LOC124315651 n=1 Tax=Daphnia pulicaria TaxID=35523 RepID=UPI001EEA2B83|nr:uncharacterized protein LOC124315651 [Daphnia pulicaria]